MKFILKQWWAWAIFVIILALVAVVYLYFNRASADVINPGVISGNLSTTTIDLSQSQKVDLSFKLAQKLYVKIYVLDSSRKVVKNIWRSTIALPAGTYDKTKYSALVWDGTSDAGAKVNEGTYSIIFDASNRRKLIARDFKNINVTSVTLSAVSVNPATFDPNNTTSSINIEIKSPGTYRLSVKDANNTIVKILADFASVPVGNYTRIWDGKNTAGQIVPNGDYLTANEIKLTDGSIALSGSATVTVAAAAPSPPLPPPPTPVITELGNTIEGAFSANFDWFKYGNKFGITFTPDKSGKLGGVNIQWKSGSSYGYNAPGTPSPHTVASAKREHGIYRVEIQESGSNGYPAGTILTATDNIYPEDAMALAKGRVVTNPETEQCTCDGSFQVNFANQPTLEAGKTYHVVITNTASNPSTNYSSANTLASRIIEGATVGGNNRGEYWNGSIWQPWTTKDSGNYFQTIFNNNLDGSHVPVLLRWVDGSFSGDPYYSAGSQSRHPTLYGTNNMGEKIVWNGDNATIVKIGVPISRSGANAPAGDLLYHIDLPNGTSLSGTMAKGSDMGSMPKWVYADVTPFVLETGRTYKIWFNSPNSNSTDYYAQHIPYGQNVPSVWQEQGWGGTTSRAFVNNIEYSDMDLSFSLQTAQ